MYKELQQTVPLTCRFLALIHPDKIHPVLVSIFGATICTRGQDKPNEPYKTEARDVAAQLPEVTEFTGLLVDKLTRGVENPLIRKVTFVLALLGVNGRSSLTTEDNKELVAMKHALKEMDTEQLKDGLMDVILRLVDWELSDRCKIAIKTLDLGFKFNKNQCKLVWCTVAFVDSVDYVNRGIFDRLKALSGLWQTDRERDDWSDLRTLARAAQVDLATFTLLLGDIEFPDMDSKDWFLQVREFFYLDDKDVWSSTDVIRFVFAFFSAHGHCALTGYFLTVEQKHLFFGHVSNRVRLEDLIPSEVFVRDIILSV
jgi:hypothetical protein